MLDRPDFNNISIETDKREIFLEFMLAYGEYITHSLDRVYAKVIANI